MLKSLDVLIGMVVVLLALSMAVTMITQSITTIINSRGRHLRRGLTDLLQQLDPALTATLSKALATRLLTHPLVSGSNTPLAANASEGGMLSGIKNAVRGLLGGPRLGNVVHREEFTKLLLNAATDTSLDAQTVATLKAALARNGIPDADAALKGIRTLALRLERSNPELSHVARQNLAILQQAESDFVAKINNWFDQSMDRTSQRFTASTRAITFAGAFIVAFGLQVDTLSLANRLAADDALRQAFVDTATQMNNRNQQQSPQQDAAAGTAADKAAGTGTPSSADSATRNDALDQEYRSFLIENGIIKLPSAGLRPWIDAWKTANYFGLLITALLLSLGAPFWYGALSNLLQLRSVLAVKDDVQRTARQTRDASGGASAPTPTPTPAASGERGDLLAVG